MRAWQFINEDRYKPTANDSPETWIASFQSGTRFKGKSPEVIRNMALAARSKAVAKAEKALIQPSMPERSLKDLEPPYDHKDSLYWDHNKTESINERKKRKKRRHAAWGPGPYGGYGFNTGYSGDGGGGTESINFNESWKQTLGSLGISAAIVGAGALGLTIKQALTSSDISPEEKVEIIKKANIPKAEIPSSVLKQLPYIEEPPEVEKFSKVQPITDNPLELVLLNAARAAGIVGVELAAFMSQCAHESHNFQSLVEYGNSAYFNRYEMRFSPKKAKLLGNVKRGDGERYKGRGYIQLTGRYNYRKAGLALGLPLEKNPELLEDPEIAAKVAIWYWKLRVQSRVSNFHNVSAVTKPINSGLRGLQNRQETFYKYLPDIIK
jgi:predicted chitinase